MIRKKLSHVSTRSRLTVRRWRATMRDIPCYIVGNGPSLPAEDMKLLEPYFTIGINRSFYAIDTTILMWQDIELWMTERSALSKSKLKAIKFSRNASDPRGIAYQFKVMPGPYRIPPNPMVLFGHGSTGPLAFQLACAIGCDPIVLLGYDCRYADGKTDFYGVNSHHKKTTLRNCSRGLKWIKNCSSRKTIINCSDNDAFPAKEKLKDVVKRLAPIYPKTGREYFVEKLFSRKGN